MALTKSRLNNIIYYGDKNGEAIYTTMTTPQDIKKEEIKRAGGLLRYMERKLDKCNHLMELMRTCLGICTLILQVVILLKLFNVI